VGADGAEVAAGAFAAAAGAEVAAGVFAVTGVGVGCVDCAEDGGVAAAGVLPEFVVLVVPGAVAVGAEVAFSAFAVPGAFAAGAVTAGAAGAVALVEPIGMAAAYALNGALNVRLVA
jgi:hypothetical protein